MEELLQQIENHKQEIAAFEAGNAEATEAFRIKYLGTKGLVKSIMGEMKNVPNEQKKHFGQLLNEFKQFTESKYELLKGQTSNDKETAANDFDWTAIGASNLFWRRLCL